MTTYQELHIHHSEYDAQQIIKNDLLYKGGQALVAHASLFLEQGSDEGNDFYHSRLQTAFDPIFSNVLDRFKSLLFAKPLQIVSSVSETKPQGSMDSQLTDFIHQFEKNCDRQGTSFHNFCKSLFSTALLHQKSYCMVDFPRAQLSSLTYADQLSSGQLNGYLCQIPLSSVINWQKDENNKFQWLVIYSEQQFRNSPIAPLMCRYRWVHIVLEAGFVVLHTYQKEINLDKNEKGLQNDDVIPELPVITTSFPEINVVEMEICDGLALGSILAPYCEQLFTTDSFINAASLRNTICLPVFKAGNNLSTPAADGRRATNLVQMNPDRFSSPRSAQQEEGWMVIGADDDIHILETEGKSIAILQDQKRILLERINASAHQAAQNIQSRSSAQAQSAAAKQEDRKDTEIILNEFKMVVDNFAMKVLKLLLQLRQQSKIEIHIEGLNCEDDVDRADVLAEMVAYGSFPDSEIFKVNFEFSHALDLLSDDISEEDKQILRQQIQASQASKSQMKDRPLQNSARSTDDPVTEEMPKKELAKSGHEAASETMHLRAQNSTSGIADAVYDQLEKDYSKRLIKWVHAANWLGPMEVNMSQIDNENMENWDAVKNPDRQDQIQKFQDMMTESDDNKPIILVNLPDNSKFKLIDGHGRFTAASNIDKPTITAYIAEVGSMKGDWDMMHRLQRQSDEGGKSQQSNQIKEK